MDRSAIVSAAGEALVCLGRTAGFLFFIIALVGGVTVLSAATGGL